MKKSVFGRIKKESNPLNSSTSGASGEREAESVRDMPTEELFVDETYPEISTDLESKSDDDSLTEDNSSELADSLDSLSGDPTAVLFRDELDEGKSLDNSANASKSSHDELVSKLKAETAENFDKYIRAVAELENYKKRAAKERSDLLKYAGESLARDLLEVADHLQLAVSQETLGVSEEYIKGVRLILDKFVSTLEKHSIKGESALGLLFDPLKHEALASVPTDEYPAGTVLEEYKKAYYFKDKLLRPAQVVVAAVNQ